MYTLEELAEELNRQEWAVERMLKNRGYLKLNGDPRKSTIDDGLMNKNGLITKTGWSEFIDVLGYKESDDDDDDLEDDDLEDDDDEDDDDEDDDDEDDDDEDDDDEDDDEYSDEELDDLIRDSLNSKSIDSDYIDDLIPVIREKVKSSLDDDDEDISIEDTIDGYCSNVESWSQYGHLLDFIILALENDLSGYCSFMDISQEDANIYSMMTDSQVAEDCDSVLENSSFNEYTKRFIREEVEYSSGWMGLDAEWTQVAYDFEKVFNKELETSPNEETAYEIAAAKCRHDTDDEINPTSKTLGELETDEEIVNWLEEKYGIEVIKYYPESFVVLYTKDGKLYEKWFDFLNECWDSEATGLLCAATDENIQYHLKRLDAEYE